MLVVGGMDVGYGVRYFGVRRKGRKGADKVRCQGDVVGVIAIREEQLPIVYTHRCFASGSWQLGMFGQRGLSGWGAVTSWRKAYGMRRCVIGGAYDGEEGSWIARAMPARRGRCH